MSGIDYTSRSAPYGVIKNTGGLNTTYSSLNVADNESTDCQNIDFDKFGSILKRNGYSTLNSSAFNLGATWTSLFWFELSSGTNFLIGTCGNKFAKMDNLDGTWDDTTGAITVTAGNANLWTWTSFLDTAIGTNGIDLPIQWTGTGNATAASVPTNLTKAKFVETWNRFVFYANVTVSGTAHPTRIYYSDIDSVTSWTATSFRDVNKNDGQDITGIKKLGDRLVIYKERSIWIAQFTGDSDIPFVFTPTPSSVGAVSGYSIQEVENGHIFLSFDGYYFFDGVNSYKLSDRINNTLFTTLEPNRFQYSASCYQRTKNRYWGAHSIAAGSTNSRCVTWDSANNAFGYYKGHNPSCFAIVYVSGQERVYFGDYSGFVYQADNGANDNPSGSSTAIDAYYYTKWFNFDDLVDKKGIPIVTIYYQISNSTLTFSYSYEFENADQYSQTFSMNTSSAVYGSAIYDTSTYAATGGAVMARALIGRGRVVRLKFSNSTLSETMQIDGFGLFPHLETAA